MKQNITSEQWNELTPPQMVQIGLFDMDYPWQKMTIGKMIEFLGDDWIRNFTLTDKYDNTEMTIIDNDTFCDDLWKFYRKKLKN